MASLISSLALLVALAAHSYGQCLVGDDVPSTVNQDAVEQLNDGRFDFALEALRRIAEIQPTENVFFSPHSLHQALGLAYFGARKDTEDQLKKALRVPDGLSKLDVQRFYAFEKSLNAQRKDNSSANYDYRVANRLWLSSDKKLRECLFNFFGQELQPTDFKKNPSEQRAKINDWVSSETQGNIKDLLPENAIDENTEAVLTNAVYFKGLWKNKFDSAKTKDGVFYLGADNMTLTKFMNQKGTFNHTVSDELRVHIVQLPYKGDDVSMFVLLPPFVSNSGQGGSEASGAASGLNQLLARLTDGEDGASRLRELMDNGLDAREILLSLPKFSLERDLPVSGLLSALNASAILDPGADFSGFVAEGERGPSLGDAVHRAKIEVSEEGTTAAAATAVFSFRSSRPTEPPEFKANHPFAYFVYDASTRAVLFAGIYRKPTKN